MSEPRYLCPNCGGRLTFDDLVNPIPDLCNRVLAGEPMPAGECPDCSELVPERRTRTEILPPFLRRDDGGEEPEGDY